MQSPLDASASTVGALFSNSTFEIPPYQREYSWQSDNVSELWNDLRENLNSDNYFLGLIILTTGSKRKHVVDGQQRIVTLTLLSTAIYFEALGRGRKALADKIQTDFLRSINYSTDETDPRVILTDPADNRTLQTILDTGESPSELEEGDQESTSALIVNSFNLLKKELTNDLSLDPFKRLGEWTDFITNKVYFAVFVHPDQATAYQVFEVINTRGRDLTTADLLKNYILSQTTPNQQDQIYQRWRHMARSYSVEGSNSTFVQFIRHVVTVRNGHIPPKALFGFLAGRDSAASKSPPNANELVERLEANHPLYQQMIDPTSSGPASDYELQVFTALNDINVIAVRPILLALHNIDEPSDGLRFILRLVVRRVVQSTLGTGNIERRFSEAARLVTENRNSDVLIKSLDDLNPTKEEFVSRLSSRSLNKNVLSFVRRSIIQKTETPNPQGTLHLIWPRNQDGWPTFDSDLDVKWSRNIGNTFLATEHKRPIESGQSWDGFKSSLLREGEQGEWVNELEDIREWKPQEVQAMAIALAEAAGDIWYGE